MGKIDEVVSKDFRRLEEKLRYKFRTVPASDFTGNTLQRDLNSMFDAIDRDDVPGLSKALAAVSVTIRRLHYNDLGYSFRATIEDLALSMEPMGGCMLEREELGDYERQQLSLEFASPATKTRCVVTVVVEVADVDDFPGMTEAVMQGVESNLEMSGVEVLDITMEEY